MSRVLLQEWKEGEAYELIQGRLYFASHPDEDYTYACIQASRTNYYFSSDLPEMYAGFCQDFGPTNIALIMRLCREIREIFEHPRLQDRPIVFYTVSSTSNRECFTNSVLMLSAYLVLVHGYSAEGALLPFARLQGMPVANYTDATWCDSTFTLHFQWYIRGLARARELGWIDAATFDIDDYERFDDPTIFNANQITPKLVAFIGPEARSQGKRWSEYKHEPGEFVGEFKRRRISTVVRLNEPGTYDKELFQSEGIEVVDLEFQDCTTPSPAVIKRFLDVVDSAKGVVAVHCMAGLGRSGTLIAIHMMKRQGFSGLEAIGLVRLMRSGSIIGPQQAFLASMDHAVWDGNLVVSEFSSPAIDLDMSRLMAAQIANAVRCP